MSIRSLFLLGCSLAVAFPHRPNIVRQETGDPGSSDPTTPPATLTKLKRPDNPFPNGWPQLPAECTDAANPNEACKNALHANDGGVRAFGGTLHHDGTCKDGKEAFLETAAWDAYMLAIESANWPQDTRDRGAAHFYNNIGRAANFKLSGNDYFTVSCKDTKDYCNVQKQGKQVGGYAWTYNGWFGYKYHYITMCPVFFTTATIDQKFTEMQEALKNNDIAKMQDARNFFTSGHMFLHEMMHTDLIGKPHINDEYIDPSDIGNQAYGPKRVHQLAARSLGQGGGATRASTNADSYAWLLSSLFWWRTTEYFPGVPNKQGPSVVEDTGPNILHLGDFHDFSALSSDDAFNKALQGLTNTDAPGDSPSPSSTPPPISSDVTLGQGTTLNSNFPKYWIMADSSKQDMKNILYRARDKACQNICDASTLESIPSQFVRTNKVGNDGCQYAIKVANNKEFYFYTTQAGQNCYDATAKIIDNTGSSKDAAWINGPSAYEFYQVGIHDINTKGPGDTVHDVFPNDNEHLGYMHFACRRADSVIAWNYHFEFKLSNWDDGDWGKSIMHEADKCDKVLGTDSWKYEDETSYKFSDQSSANKQGSFTLSLAISSRCGEKAIEKVLGLRDGSVQCPMGNNFSEVDMFGS